MAQAQGSGGASSSAAAASASALASAVAAPQQQHHQSVFSWPMAPQPDMVRAVQKDELYLDHVAECVQDAVARALGPLPAMMRARECRLVASALYYLLTTGAGLQTLGEEYCDVLQLSGPGPSAASAAAAAAASTSSQAAASVCDARQPVPALTRVALSLLQALGPYAAERVAAALAGAAGDDDDNTGAAGSEWWSPAAATIAGPASEGRGLRGDNDDDGSGVGGGGGGGGDMGAALSSSSAAAERSIRQRCQQALRTARRRREALLAQARAFLAPRWPQLCAAAHHLARAHLALFYLTGAYYQWEKRLLGVTHASTSPLVARRASYRALGWVLCAQLAVAAAAQAWPVVERRVVAAKRRLGAPGGAGDDGGGGGRAGGGGGGARLDSGSDDAAALMGAPVGQHAALLPDALASEAASAAARGQQQQQQQQPWHLTGEGSSRASRRCPLCLSPRSNPACTPCGHVFCWDCIAQWCAEKPECPLCRAGVIPPQLVCIYHSDF